MKHEGEEEREEEREEEHEEDGRLLKKSLVSILEEYKYFFFYVLSAWRITWTISFVWSFSVLSWFDFPPFLPSLPFLSFLSPPLFLSLLLF